MLDALMLRFEYPSSLAFGVARVRANPSRQSWPSRSCSKHHSRTTSRRQPPQEACWSLQTIACLPHLHIPRTNHITRGKSFNLSIESFFLRLFLSVQAHYLCRVEPIVMSAGELEHEWAGTPGERLSFIWMTSCETLCWNLLASKYLPLLSLCAV